MKQIIEVKEQEAGKEKPIKETGGRHIEKARQVIRGETGDHILDR